MREPEFGQEKLTVYHDGSCLLCSAEIAVYRGAAGAEALGFVDAADPCASLGPDLPRDIAMARFHVRDADGRLVSGAAAFVALWKALPGWRWLETVVGSRWVLPIAEGAYRVFLLLRPSIARTLAAVHR